MKSGIAFSLLCSLVVAGALPALAQDAAAEASNSPFAVTLIMRWVHVLSAIAMLGGALFMRLVLKGALAETAEENREAVAGAVRKRWKMFVMLLTTLLLISGFYNYLMVTRFEHDGNPQYHMLFGIKFLLSLAVFTLAMFLIGNSSIGKKLQANDKLWLGVLCTLGVAVVLIAGYMKVM